MRFSLISLIHPLRQRPSPRREQPQSPRDGGRLRRWEAALLAAFALFLLAGASARAAEGALADKVLRLHVVANSDSPEDQAVKLRVRDAVLARAEGLLAGVSDRAGAEAVLALHLEELAEAGQAVLVREGRTEGVTAALEDVWFPTRIYEEGFALPAGNYRALRVIIGAGQGRNWWCVVFPPLCLASVTEEAAAAAGLTDGQIALITGRDGGYVLKFKVLEWWESLMHRLEGK